MTTAESTTGTSLLTGWLAEPRSDRVLKFADDEGGWRDFTYEELAARARGAAAQIVERGGGPGSSVVIVLPTGSDFIAAFFGALLAGATPVPLAPPGFFDQARYRGHLSRVLDGARPSVILTDDFLLAEVQGAIEGSSVALEPTLASFDADASFDPAPLPDLALLQYTSGSSGDPRGVRVTRRNIETYLAGASAAGQFSSDDVGAFWIPLYHDLGLIGALLPCMAHQQTMYWMRPDHFVRRPELWIECLGRHGATLTAVPTFALWYASKRVSDEFIADMDFSAVRGVGLGAERVDVKAVSQFVERFAPRGFKTTAICSGYGLAEATLAVTAIRLHDEPRAALVDWRRLRIGEALDPVQGSFSEAAASENPDEWLLSCGPPHVDTGVRIVDEDGAELPDGHLGEIVVTGSLVADGYVGDGAPSRTFRDGELYTADAGFVVDGELYVLGRIGDMITVRGRNVYVEDLEARLGAIGLPKGRFAVVAGPEQVLTIVERRPGEWADEALRLLLRHVGDQYAVTVMSVEPGSIERTSSGKPRRRSMWQSYSAGTLAGTVVAEAGEPGSRPPDGPSA